jgi:hypothetical protein
VQKIRVPGWGSSPATSLGLPRAEEGIEFRGKVRAAVDRRWLEQSGAPWWRRSGTGHRRREAGGFG